MDLSKLKEPFPLEDLEFRLQSCGKKDGRIWAKCLTYVTNRAICNRLDEVVGPENWKNEFCAGPNGGVLCGISIRINNEFITKWDGAENTDIEAVKGGLSGAMKRAASTGWSIGRYLYRLEESWAIIDKNGKYSGKTKDGEWFRWNPPALPAWALPAGSPLQVEGGTQAIIDLQKFLKDGALDDRPKMKAGAEQAIKDNDLEKIQKYIEACKGKKAS